MAEAIKEGDRVQVVNREATADDVKSGLFYNYFRGLEGSIQKIYNTQEVAVEIDLDSLDEAVMKRHIDIQEQTKTKWLDSLSEEARGRLTEQERDFRLRYSILVKDVDLAAPGSQTVPERFAIIPQAAPKLASLSAPTITSLPEVLDMDSAETTPQRTTLDDIEAAEEAYLMTRSAADDV